MWWFIEILKYECTFNLGLWLTHSLLGECYILSNIQYVSKNATKCYQWRNLLWRPDSLINLRGCNLFDFFSSIQTLNIPNIFIVFVCRTMLGLWLSQCSGSRLEDRCLRCDKHRPSPQRTEGLTHPRAWESRDSFVRADVTISGIGDGAICSEVVPGRTSFGFCCEIRWKGWGCI